MPNDETHGFGEPINWRVRAEAAEAALVGLRNFAWSMVTLPNNAARENLQGMLNTAKAVLAAVPVPVEEPDWMAQLNDARLRDVREKILKLADDEFQDWCADCQESEDFPQPTLFNDTLEALDELIAHRAGTSDPIAEARRQALEEAAVKCEELAEIDDKDDDATFSAGWAEGAISCARIIRALMEKQA